MSLSEEVERYTELTGRDGLHTPIGLISSYFEGYEQGKRDAQQWIPVTERKPTDWSFVLITDSDDVYMGYINTIGEWMDLTGNRIKDIIAWMPLIEPYKGGAEECH